MHVLRGTHAALVPGGTLIDLHPVPPSGRIEAGGLPLGRLDEGRFFEVVRATEAGMDAAVADGLYRYEERFWREIVERFDDAAELLETADEWENIELPTAVRARVESTEGKIDLIERVVFRRLRAV